MNLPDGVSWLESPDLDAYASGQIGADEIRCALCQPDEPGCNCPPFGTAEYFALVNRRHGKGPR